MTYTPKLRMYSGPGKPLYSGDDYIVGYYDAGVMRQVVDAFGIDYKVFSIPVPANSFQRDYLRNLLNKPSVIYSLVDKNKVVFVTADNQNHADNWMFYLQELGYDVKDNDKASKRLKSFHRPTLLNARFDLEELNVHYVDPSEYSNYYFDNLTEVYKRMLILELSNPNCYSIYRVKFMIIKNILKKILLLQFKNSLSIIRAVLRINFNLIERNKKKSVNKKSSFLKE
jgi:hypothetical protein